MRIKKLKKGDKKYPKALGEIYNPPTLLFVAGEILESDANAVAIVGTRRATLYGLGQCERIAFDLALRGITVVSGMAKGIDTAAHRGALKAGGRTIAVLGSGHDNIYPTENKKLYTEIIKSGAVVSEFPPETLPFPTNFPRRNRIVSGMSKGVLVIEAPKRSGALITANFALEQGREVFAMPGNISSVKSFGTNALIKEGAKLVETVDDILEELKLVLDRNEPKKPIQAPHLNRWSDSGAGPELRLSSDEKAVFGILGDEPRQIDEISRISNISTNRISAILLGLELKRLIKTLPGENFIRK